MFIFRWYDEREIEFVVANAHGVSAMAGLLEKIKSTSRYPIPWVS
jgi:hypothetical protein